MSAKLLSKFPLIARGLGRNRQVASPPKFQSGVGWGGVGWVSSLKCTHNFFLSFLLDAFLSGNSVNTAVKSTSSIQLRGRIESANITLDNQLSLEFICSNYFVIKLNKLDSLFQLLLYVHFVLSFVFCCFYCFHYKSFLIWFQRWCSFAFVLHLTFVSSITKYVDFKFPRIHSFDFSLHFLAPVLSFKFNTCTLYDMKWMIWIL